jgi:signal transduction histidine kinase
VLVNLLANAVKFSPAQSEIYLAARTIGVDLEITVKDSGPGMDRATSEKIFERFFRSNNQNQQAFGLGLAICKLLVEAHGGEIAVQSELGRGSTFIIDIPDAVSR